MLSCELSLGDQCMYVYEDSNFGGFRIPNVYVHAHKWLEHQLLGQSLPVSNFAVCMRRRLLHNSCFYLQHILKEIMQCEMNKVYAES